MSYVIAFACVVTGLVSTDLSGSPTTELAASMIDDKSLGTGYVPLCAIGASAGGVAALRSLRPFSEPRGKRAPIDMFFRSVAPGRGDGLAVLLSGAGSDGSTGVWAIQEAGGGVFVQHPVEAEFPAIPRNAIATGVVSFVEPIKSLAER